MHIREWRWEELAAHVHEPHKESMCVHIRRAGVIRGEWTLWPSHFSLKIHIQS